MVGSCQQVSRHIASGRASTDGRGAPMLEGSDSAQGRQQSQPVGHAPLRHFACRCWYELTLLARK